MPTFSISFTGISLDWCKHFAEIFHFYAFIFFVKHFDYFLIDYRFHRFFDWFRIAFFISITPPFRSRRLISLSWLYAWCNISIFTFLFDFAFLLSIIFDYASWFLLIISSRECVSSLIISSMWFFDFLRWAFWLFSFAAGCFSWVIFFEVPIIFSHIDFSSIISFISIFHFFSFLSSISLIPFSSP